MKSSNLGRARAVAVGVLAWGRARGIHPEQDGSVA